jgi:hypothetical protein
MTRSPGAKIVPTAASKGSRVSSILQQVAKGPEVFGELARELGMEAPAARAPQTKAAAVAQAVREGEPLARVVDLTAVPYDYASAARRELGITGAQAEAAHHGPTAMLKNIPGYSRGQSLTTLLPRAVHRAFDAPWKRWWASGARTNPNLGWLQKYQQVERAAMQTPGLTARARATLAWLAFQDFAKGEIALAEAGRASAATDISGTARASAPAAATPAAALPAAATPVAAAPAAAAPASVAASAAGPATVSSALDASAAAKPRIAMPANVAGAADVAPGANARIANPAEAAHTPPAAQGGPRVSVPVEEAPEALLEDAAESPAARQQQMVLPDPLKRKLK